MIYQNFDLEIICPHGGERLCARVLDSPQGDCPFIDVKWPFEAEAENGLMSDIYGGLRQRRGRSSKANAIEDFGGKLFEAVFSGDIEHLFRSSLDTSFREGKGLRIRLRLPEDSDLHMRPWEFLFDTESREFLAVHEHTPLVRYLPVAQPIPPITVEGPLRVLVALSSPTDHPRLDIVREWEILCHALEPSITAGQLELRRVPGRCTFDNLRDSLRHFGAHIFHFVGHGIPGALVLEQESGKGLEMEATHLRSAFPSGALPRLIVLNACSGAITQDVPFSGLAQGFLRQGVPAVVAMQASITDDAAMIFTRYFYRDLVEIGAVDASLTEARLRMQGNGHPIEWGTPVLYMRALSGQLFQPAAIRPGPPLVMPAPMPPMIPAAVPAAIADERKRQKETQARNSGAPPRVEPTLNEKKKIRDLPPRQEAAPPQPAASPPEKKKPRPVKAKDAPAPRPEAQEQAPLPPVQPTEPVPQAPAQALGHAMPEQLQPRKEPPPTRPEPMPAAEVEKPAPPPPPEPGPAAPTIAPAIEPEKPAPPVRPEPKPVEQRIVRKVPAGKPAAPPEAPAQPAEHGAPKVEAKKHVLPPKLEPILDDLDEPAVPQQVPRQDMITPTFILEPEPKEPGLAAAAASPESSGPAPGKAPAPAARGRQRLVYGSAAGLLVLGLAIGIATLRPGTDTPAPAPTTPPSSASTARPDTPLVAAPEPSPAPSPAVTDGAPPPVVSRPGTQARADPDKQTKAAAAKPASTARKTRPAASAAADNCDSPVVSERSANCVFRNK